MRRSNTASSTKASQQKTLRVEVLPVFAPLLKPARYKGVWGGRGSGKSHFFATALVTRAAFLPTRAVCVREIQKSLDQSVKRLLEDKIEVYGLGHRFRILDTQILPKAGGIILFQGMQNHTADSIKSLEGYDVAWVEEAQSLSQRSLDLLRPTIRKEGSELWFSWNPNKPTDPIDRLLRDNPPPESVVVRANYSDNRWLPDVLQKEMEWDRQRDPDKYAHIWLGEYQRNSEARVFRNWRVEAFETPSDAVFYMGADWGFSVDPSVLVRCFIHGRTLYVDHEAYQVGCEIDALPALFGQVPGALKWRITADSARPETISYMKRQQFNVVPAAKGAGSVEDGLEFLKSYDIIVHPRCRHVIDELSLYSYKTDKLTGNVLPVVEDANNHCIDALRYAVEAVRKAATPRIMML